MHNKDNPKYRLYLAGIITENQYLEDAEERKTIFVLVGPPAVGKSTWIKETFRDEQPYIINRDSIAEEVARGIGMTYDDMFAAPPEGSVEGSEHVKYGRVVKSPQSVPGQSLSLSYSKILAANSSINEQLEGKMAGAATSGRDIVVDKTNMTREARSNALSAVAGKDEMFRKVAVVFPFEEEVIQKIAFKRSMEIKLKGGSKTIPPEVLEATMRKFQEVSNDEGFDVVINVDNRELFREQFREKLRELSRGLER